MIDNNSEITMFLGDLVHNYVGSATYYFPLNIGYLSSFLLSKINNTHLSCNLFKFPNELISAIDENPPDILSLSNYSWNADLNSQIAKFAHKKNEELLIIFGGPNVSYNKSGLFGYEKFHKTNPSIDCNIFGEGEKVLYNVVNSYLSNGCDKDPLKKENISSAVFFSHDHYNIGPLEERIKNLDEIPSPYLSGIMDSFFETNLIPILETNRGCPFKCSYCAQGQCSRYKLVLHPLERVFDELEYIGKKTKHTNKLLLADANFGIHPRDVKIAKRIRTLSKESNYPRSVGINFIKDKRLLNVANILEDLTILTASIQALDKDVLSNINRENVPIEDFISIIKYANEKGFSSGTEFILGLPGETKESHEASLRYLFDLNIKSIIVYNLLLIGGSKLADPESIDKFGISYKYRLLDCGFGYYSNEISSFEYEIGVRETYSLKESDILFFRPIHWLIQMCWNYRLYLPLLKFLQIKGINPYDFFKKMVLQYQHFSLEIDELFSSFTKESENEWFNSKEEMIDYYYNSITKLKNGDIGKLNYKYMWNVILENKTSFDYYVEKIAIDILPEYQKLIKELVIYSSKKLIDFTNTPFRFNTNNVVTYSYDFVTWEKMGYISNPENIVTRISYLLPKVQQDAIDLLIKQYSHVNQNLMFRKMCENMRVTDLFFDVEKIL